MRDDRARENRRTLSVEVGDTFGSLTITEVGLRYRRGPMQIRMGMIGDRAVKARCLCGRERVIRLANLFSTTKPVRGCHRCSGRDDEGRFSK